MLKQITVLEVYYCEVSSGPSWSRAYSTPELAEKAKLLIQEKTFNYGTDAINTFLKDVEVDCLTYPIDFEDGT